MSAHSHTSNPNRAEGPSSNLGRECAGSAVTSIGTGYAVEPPFSIYNVAKDILCDVVSIEKEPYSEGSTGKMYFLFISK